MVDKHHAAQQWVQSEMVHQERTDRNGQVHRWRERKIHRSLGTDEKNGNLQPLLYTPIDSKAKHSYSSRAMPTSQPNKHLMVRDDYPEVLGAEISAIHGKKYFIPRTGPEAVASNGQLDSQGTTRPQSIRWTHCHLRTDLSPIHMATYSDSCG